jgi:dCMP deaminase
MSNKDEKHMALAQFVGDTYSKDRSTKVGCVIVGVDNEVLSVGYNGFPRGADDDTEARHERPEKYLWSEHSERNAIYNAARIGVSLKGATAYVTPLECCIDCARGLVQVGIKRIVMKVSALSNERAAAWAVNRNMIMEMYEECGVEVDFV